MATYVMPDKNKERVREGYQKLLLADDILKKLAAMGRPMAEAEIKSEELRKEAKLMADVFDIDLGEE